ncbi:hypothetical protein BN1723_020095, partial [Verticillium longisporum]
LQAGERVDANTRRSPARQFYPTRCRARAAARGASALGQPRPQGLWRDRDKNARDSGSSSQTPRRG